MKVRAARGAIVVSEDTPGRRAGGDRRDSSPSSSSATTSPPRSSSRILFTATEDLRSVFPAEAARAMGLGRVPLMCAREIPVEGAMPSVVRVLMHFHTEAALDEVTHVYLDGAESLRDDLG